MQIYFIKKFSFLKIFFLQPLPFSNPAPKTIPITSFNNQYSIGIENFTLYLSLPAKQKIPYKIGIFVNQSAKRKVLKQIAFSCVFLNHLISDQKRETEKEPA